jgi:hypothetical protein
VPENKNGVKIKLSLCIPGRQMEQWRYCSTYSTSKLIGVAKNGLKHGAVTDVGRNFFIYHFP